MVITRSLLKAIGIEDKRFRQTWISASEGTIFQDVVNEMSAELRELGPFQLEKSENE